VLKKNPSYDNAAGLSLIPILLLGLFSFHLFPAPGYAEETATPEGAVTIQEQETPQDAGASLEAGEAKEPGEPEEDEAPPEAEAGTEEEDAPPEERRSRRLRRVPAEEAEEELEEEILDVQQSGTQRKYELELSVNPRVEDALDEFFIRIPVRVKYGIWENWEVSVRFGTFLDNPTQGESRNGLSDITLGTKYRFQEKFRKYVNTAVAFAVLLPTGSNEDINDGYIRYRPSIIFSRVFEARYRLEFTWSVGLDLLGSAQNEADPDLRDSLALSMGIFNRRAAVSPFFETTFVTDEIDNGTDNSVFLTPGVRWDFGKDIKDRTYGIARSFSFGVRFGLFDADDDISLITRFKIDLPLKYRRKVREEDKPQESEEPADGEKQQVSSVSFLSSYGR
jgi:hypothetical protein